MGWVIYQAPVGAYTGWLASAAVVRMGRLGVGPPPTRPGLSRCCCCCSPLPPPPPPRPTPPLVLLTCSCVASRSRSAVSCCTRDSSSCGRTLPPGMGWPPPAVLTSRSLRAGPMMMMMPRARAGVGWRRRSAVVRVHAHAARVHALFCSTVAQHRCGYMHGHAMPCLCSSAVQCRWADGHGRHRTCLVATTSSSLVWRRYSAHRLPTLAASWDMDEEAPCRSRARGNGTPSTRPSLAQA